MKQINDPVFGDLEYDGVKKGWTKRIPLGIWGAVDYQLDLILKCDEDEEITEEQRDGYKSYLKNLPNFAQDVRETIFLFYKEHYEDFHRKFRLPDKLNIDVADEKTTIRFFLHGHYSLIEMEILVGCHLIYLIDFSFPSFYPMASLKSSKVGMC